MRSRTHTLTAVLAVTVAACPSVDAPTEAERGAAAVEIPLAIVETNQPALPPGTECLLRADSTRESARTDELEWTLRCGETVVYVGAARVSDRIWPARRHAYDARTTSDDGNAAFVLNTPYVTVWDDETGPLGAIRLELRSSRVSALHLGRSATVL